MKETGWNCSKSHAYPMISQYPTGLMTKDFIDTPSTKKKSSFGGGWTSHLKKTTFVQSGLHIPLNRVVKIHQTTTHWKMQPGHWSGLEDKPPFKDGRFVGVHRSFFGGCILVEIFIPKTSINQPMLAKQAIYRFTFPESCSPVSDEEAHLETLSRFFNRCKWRVSHKTKTRWFFRINMKHHWCKTLDVWWFRNRDKSGQKRVCYSIIEHSFCSSTCNKCNSSISK